MDDFSVDLVDVKSDGSCFFSCIAVSMNDSLHRWKEYDFLRTKMEMYWDKYTKEYEGLHEVTPHLIRFICAENLDSDMFETYCIEAEDRVNDKEIGVEKFNSLAEMKEAVLDNLWGCHSTIKAFFKAFQNRCSLVIFDKEFGGVVYFQKEWTKKKDIYICIQRTSNHYKAMRICKGEKKLDLCLSRKEMVDFKIHVNSQFKERIKNEY